MYKHILVAVDGSSTSQLAFNEALKFAKAGSQLTAVTVVDNPFINYGYDIPASVLTFGFEEAHADFIKQAKDILTQTEIDADKHAGVKMKTCLVDMGFNLDHGDIAKAIEKTAIDCNADLLVIGTHGRRGIKRLFLGSVAEHVIRHSHIPVLLIRGKMDEPSLGAD